MDIILDRPSQPPLSCGKPKYLVVLLHGAASNGDGEDSGVNIRFDALEPYLVRVPNLQAQAGQRDTLITLCSEGDPGEDVCVLMIAAAFGAEL